MISVSGKRAARGWIWILLLVAWCGGGVIWAASAATQSGSDSASASSDPVLNRFATAMFALAVLHTFLAPQFMRLAHRFERSHRERLAQGGRSTELAEAATSANEVSFKAELFHFLGEIEVVFGLWVVPLFLGMIWFQGWTRSVQTLNAINFTEPLFVLVIMSVAASRPVMAFAQALMSSFARIGKYSVGAWWFSILTLGPLLGSFITEPAAMTISALLLSRKFFDRFPSKSLAYATLGLLFVNVSIGGTLTHFAAPPVLMVAGKWNWDMPFMFVNFGWKAVLAISISNILYWSFYRKEFARMNVHQPPSESGRVHRPRVPKSITILHLGFLAWTVATNHYPVLFLGGFLFFVGFSQATAHHQDDLALRTPLLVAFFLAGLVIHGGFQAWWIAPLLATLAKLPLYIGAIILTSFNDNAAITYLASLVPNLSPELKYAVVSGAVVGGGLTVIANAPNPAGISILNRFFDDSVSPLWLLAGAFPPTLIAALCFFFFS
jgi:hypothetical protein